MTSDTIIVLAGPSGSGKSTYADKIAKERGFVVISPDECRKELTGDASDQSKNAFIFNTLLPIRINGAHTQGMGAIIDATSTTRKARKLLIDYAKVAGYTRIECHVVHADEATCQARNAARERVVPQKIISQQFARWQEPSIEEGFDQIVYAQSALLVEI
jgi:predicted kinase